MTIIVLLCFGLIALSVSACHIKNAGEPDGDLTTWWKAGVIYQIYPRSFMDSNGDGIGDLNGITSKLAHIKDTGADTVWLSPIFSSPQKDLGYDVSNYTDINPEFGTLEDFDKFIAKARELKLKVMLDFVPNHSSDQHEWFKKSVDRIKPYDEYYIWRDAKVGPNGERMPPNNWLCRFGGSTWEWNEKRQQYYYHVFFSIQPDLNYRNPAVLKEMEDVLTFWMDRGADGFRIDAPYVLLEDLEMRDNPKSNNTKAPQDDFRSLNNIYNVNSDENYSIIKSWKLLLDAYAKNHKTGSKILMSEIYAPNSVLLKFFEVGGNPFNFMFIKGLNSTSTAAEFKSRIETWVSLIPRGYTTNWVIGNHDNSRVASRFGERRADQISLLSGILPGITVLYNGDEIGMVDRFFTYNETIDAAACHLGPDGYQSESRDPERTPFQWDNTANAGFSTGAKTWWPVNSNYKTLNLKNEIASPKSHYKIFQSITRLKKMPILRDGTLELILPHEKVLAVVRRLVHHPTVVLLINFADEPVKIDAKTSLNIDKKSTIQIASLMSGLTTGTTVDTTVLVLPGAASVVLY